MLYSYSVINWPSIIVNSFWIIGLAILLAAFSYHFWLADIEKRHLKEQLARPAFQKFYWLGLTFVGIGLAGTSQKTWEIAIWIIFTLFGIVNTAKAK